MRFLTLFCLFISFAVNAEQTPIRILELVPDNWLKYPLIEPYIPEDYIASNTLLSEKYPDKVLWGRKEDLEAHLKDENAPINSPIFSLFPSCDTVQIGKDQFSGEEMIGEQLSKIGFKNVKVTKLFWGDYPVLSIESIFPDGNLGCFAWVGLNDEGWVLSMRFIPSSSQSVKESLQTWHDFLANTKKLGEPDSFTARGMDMQDGVTFYRVASARLKAVAERRSSDGKVGIKVVPVSPDTTCEVKSASLTRMGTKWKFGAPCAKVLVVVTEKVGKGKTIIDGTITVLTKDVKKFSFDDGEDNVVVLDHPLDSSRRRDCILLKPKIN